MLPSILHQDFNLMGQESFAFQGEINILGIVSQISLFMLSKFNPSRPVLKAFKAFRKPFEAPQRSVRIKI